MNATKRFVHQKINFSVASQIADSDIAAPGVSIAVLFRNASGIATRL